MDEAALWASLSDHPRIHRFLRACLSPKYIISAFHRYGDVSKYLKTHPYADRVALVRDIAAGMDFLHKRGGLHGDLKATNVLVDDGGKACISDFGLSEVRQESETISQALKKGKTDGPVTGTMRWMSPERLRGGSLDPKVDVYAFGMTCYEVRERNYSQ
ncbi:kinase-like protein [Exidia glandulosa HHB12029]|uniref:Kinase-like protein n=1 Tax=Exidia glandulosa HHB12029 TaxID=1314781 RepID=A0A165Q6L1_EXIGL|nr:kinase-like protein [Exidia glandulosa HHB12029]